MSVPCAENLSKYENLSVDLITNQSKIGNFFKSKKIFENIIVIKWGASKCINLLSLLTLSLRIRGLYDYLIIPDAINKFAAYIFNFFAKSRVISMEDIEEGRRSNLRIENNLLMSNLVIEDVKKKYSIKHKKFFHGITRKSNVESKQRRQKVAVFLSASLGFKAAPAKVIGAACNELVSKNYIIYEVTDGSGYQLTDLAPSVKPLQLMNFDDLEKFFLEIDLFISGDTGLAHFADILGVDVILISGPTDVTKTKPLNSKILKTRLKLDCMPCYGTNYYEKCPFGNKCMTSIEFLDVVSMVASGH
jgi:ADP-heptose:LPS heptosyltransferase